MSISTDVITSYKKIDEAYIDSLLEAEIKASNKKIVVLDDDPTGVQTVHDISVYTSWDKDSIRAGFDEENSLFYVLTNSRGFTAEQTTKAHHEIAAVVDEVAKETGKEYIFISRSDSTLRGHYPLETELLKADYEKNTGKVIDGEILCPFFKEGGRMYLCFFQMCASRGYQFHKLAGKIFQPFGFFHDYTGVFPAFFFRQNPFYTQDIRES